MQPVMQPVTESAFGRGWWAGDRSTRPPFHHFGRAKIGKTDNVNNRVHYCIHIWWCLFCIRRKEYEEMGYRGDVGHG